MSKFHPRRHSAHPANFSAQHMLINKRLVHDMIALANLQSGDTVLDIGAGAGAITIPLAKGAGEVIAVERDPALIKKLKRKAEAADVSNIRTVSSDILQMMLPRKPFAVVANIPYSITTPILGKLMDIPAVPMQNAVLLVEKGAAKRFTAPSIRDARVLGWRMFYELRLVRTVPPSDFSPPPKVDSAVLAIRRRKEPLIPGKHHARFLALADAVLRDPRTPLAGALSGIFTPPQIARLVRRLGKSREEPVGGLLEEEWGELFRAMLLHVPPERWPKLMKRESERPGKTGKPRKT